MRPHAPRSLAIVLALLFAAPASADTPPAHVLTWGSLGTGPGQFNLPTDIAVASNGDVYVVDGDNHRIQKFDALGNFQFAWGVFGPDDGEFKYPTGICIDSVGNVFVGDTDNNRIQKFTAAGTFLAAYGS